MKKITALLLALMLMLTAPLACAEYLEVTNPKLDSWTAAYAIYLAFYMKESEDFDFDYAAGSGTIPYNPTQTRKSARGEAVADGGMNSHKGTFSMGVGAGVTNEELWYVNFTFNEQTSMDDMVLNTQLALYATEAIGLNLGEGDDADDLRAQILATLLASTENVAIEKDGMVLFTKLLSDGVRLVGINSLAFYNAFYAGTIATYFDLNAE